jgi:hypothetical protein
MSAYDRHRRVPSPAAFALLRETVTEAERDAGVVLRADTVAPAAELIGGEYAVARDGKSGIELYATALGIGYLHEIDDMSEE